MGNIFKSNWKAKSCKSCGPPSGGDDDKRKPLMVLLVLAGITVPGLIMLGANHLASQHVRIHEARCAWDESENRYVAEVTVQNDDNAYKMVSFYVQGRFRPPQGAQWPEESLKARFEATREYSATLLGPREARHERVAFEIPGVKEFACTAEGVVDRQARFDGRPTLQSINTAMAELGAGGGEP